MNDENVQLQINEINRKLDIILEEIELQKRQRRNIEDLQDDITRVGKELYKTAVDELEELHDNFNTKDLLYLSKKLLRNVRTITATLEQLESARDFVEDFIPISREMIIEFMNKLDEYDRKGYFDFFRESMRAFDKVISELSPEQIQNMSTNIPVTIDILKKLVDPELLGTVSNAVDVYKKTDIEATDNISLFSLYKEFNKPATKQSLMFMLKLLQNLNELKTIKQK